jgi:hypothetical protein
MIFVPVFVTEAQKPNPSPSDRESEICVVGSVSQELIITPTPEPRVYAVDECEMRPDAMSMICARRQEEAWRRCDLLRRFGRFVRIVLRRRVAFGGN